MGLDLVSTGKNPPDEINVIIEIQKDSERPGRHPGLSHPFSRRAATGRVPARSRKA